MTRCYYKGHVVVYIVTICFFLAAFACNRDDSNSGTSEAGLAKAELDLSEDDLEVSQVKLAYIGIQTAPLALTVVFSTDQCKVTMNRFIDFQKKGIYPNDAAPAVDAFSVTPKELRRMLLAVEPTLSKIKRPTKDPELALVLVRETDGSYKGCEFFIEKACITCFYKSLIGGLQPANKTGIEALTRQFERVVPFDER